MAPSSVGASAAEAVPQPFALRAGAWPTVACVSAAAIAMGGCGIMFPADTTVLVPISFARSPPRHLARDEPASLVIDVTSTGALRRLVPPG